MKGHADHFDAVVAPARRDRAAWSYPDHPPRLRLLRNHVAFYAAAMDARRVDGEATLPQPGGFSGGWIASRVAGPLKRVPGSRFG